MDSVVENSEWAEMPSILHLYESKLAKVCKACHEGEYGEGLFVRLAIRGSMVKVCL